jgi:two-component system, OmpR family, sensor histidine kinase CpxA
MFVRILLSFWAVMWIVTTVAISLSSSFQNDLLRSLPLNTLQVCAAKAADSYRTSGAKALQNQTAGCYDGLLLPPGVVAKTDLSGRALSREERRVARRAQHGTDTVLQPFPKGTIIALRADPNSSASYLFIAAIPLPAHNFVMWSAGLFLRLALISGLSSLVVTAYFVRPITRLNDVAEQFGAGDLKARAHPSLTKRKDELGDLGRTFNQMAVRIESLVIRYKSFLAHASHELGSPLTRLNIALALARRKAGHHLEPEHHRIGQEADRLNSLMQELLLLARLESGNELSRNPVLFDIAELVAEACENALFEAQQVQKTVSIVAQEGFQVRGYPDLMRRALDNVLRNGLRFAKKQGCVQISYSVSYSRENDSATGIIQIQDDGPGVSPGHEESIFEPFFTLSDGANETAGGSGLGLAIARQAIFANGGKIYAHSFSGSGGLTVVIELPAELMAS